MDRTIGICLGASTIGIAERVDGEIRFSSINHDGRVAQTLREIAESAFPARIGITGRKFKNLLDIPTISEPEAVELAFDHIRRSYPGTGTIVSAGGETFLAYLLDRHGKIRTVHTGNKCASGTGEFFLQQIKRMGLNIEEALALAESAESYNVAGRCSVFCKSDCTHALNKGVEKGRIVAGLCRMMAQKLAEILKKSGSGRIAVIGGVSRNEVVMRYLRESCPNVYVPEEALCFEALGALLWAEKNGPRLENSDSLMKPGHLSFPLLPGLREGEALVSFKEAPRGEFHDGDYILGLDVGSTTTKAVLVRSDSRAIVAGTYLRTNGDPVGASRECYRDILAQVPAGRAPNIIGLGVTGSGRQIAGLHALTGGVVNEILAHAAAAVHFDPEVETIFEIGGQDAKYTSITSRVASDYAMNEACSAGTGSFLEEACRESLGIDTLEIAGIALQSDAPPNFSDQCAAFIGSDIKTAVQEGIAREEIVAGLVYSVCQNYLNRVKGNRPVGRKIFMQGGVCYNRAVPVAMANLCGREIIVPPEPGLMGAFGAALEVMHRFEAGILEKNRFDLAEMAAREIDYGQPFVCNGGKEKCDRKCSIARIVINDKTYPFGGACNKFYNLVGGKEADAGKLDLVRIREELVYRKYAPAETLSEGMTVGILPSLFTNTLYPLYAHFFHNLGVRTVTVDHADPEGMEATGSSFCFPVIQGHGFLKELLKTGVDRVFIPHVKNARIEAGEDASCACPFVQGEPYYLKAAFHDDLEKKLVTAVLDLGDRKKLKKAFAGIAKQLGFPANRGVKAFADAWGVFTAMLDEMQEYGRRFMAELKPEDTAIVLFGRPYNAFSRFGNMGIPHKFASRAYPVIPHDFLPLHELDIPDADRMYWATGKVIMKAATHVANHPALFGAYITNFSCGPDSFLTGYFRNIMGDKPSLTLELDAHSADAGVDTRIEAFLDVIKGYRELRRPAKARGVFTPAQVVTENGMLQVLTGKGEKLPLTDPRVRLLIPSMGEASARSLAAAFRHVGINAQALDAPGQQELNLGKGEATCKECLPLLLTTGSLLRYLQGERDKDEVIVAFMPESDGPCRLGQYRVFLENLYDRHRLENVALMSLTFENGYAGLSTAFTRRAWQAIVVSDGLDDIYAGILTLAEEQDKALALFAECRERIFASIATDSRSRLLEVLREEMQKLASLRKHPIEGATKVSLVGEMYVRRDGFSRQFLVERLAKRGILVKTAPVAEWIYFSDYCATRDLTNCSSLKEKLGILLKHPFKRMDERAIQECFSQSGFYEPYHVDMKYLMTRGELLVHPELALETNLTVSATLSDLGDENHGVISIGPFGCLPCRISEAILNYRLHEEKENFSRHNSRFWAGNKDDLPLPFLAIESDGNPFPQLVDARLESFVLAAHRLKGELAEMGRNGGAV
ncbi:MAG: CoA activase [Geobacter sp.]|nr:CoA activase [Geobacter sp.]